MTTPFSIPIENPQIDENARNIETLQTTTATNTADISTIDSTAAFMNDITKNVGTFTNNGQITAQGANLRSNGGYVDSQGGKLIVSTGTTGHGTLHFSRNGYIQHNRIHGHENGDFWKQDFYVKNYQAVRIAKNQNATPYLDVNGIAYSNDGRLTSDDRLKFNETDISNSLEILNQLKPMKYEKILNNKEGKDWIPSDASWNEVKNETDAEGNELWNYTDEIGLIAQDVQKIPELAFCVSGEETDKEGNQTPLHLNYNSIFSLLIQSVKDLKNELDELKQNM